MKITALERFKKHYIKLGPDDCWIWTGYKNKKGYGRFYYQGKLESAHRIAFMFESGIPLQECGFVLHKCDNPPCVNPSHLFSGDAQINADDCKSKGRHCFGVRNGRAKLNPRSVLQIRLSAEPTSVLANKYGVSSRAINKVKRGESWVN